MRVEPVHANHAMQRTLPLRVLNLSARFAGEVSAALPLPRCIWRHRERPLLRVRFWRRPIHCSDAMASLIKLRKRQRPSNWMTTSTSPSRRGRA